MKQVNTLCYYYAHFTAKRAQLKKKKKLEQQAQMFWLKTLFSFLHFFLHFLSNQTSNAKKLSNKDGTSQYIMLLLCTLHC